MGIPGGWGGITRSGSDGSYTYAVVPSRADMPVTYVSTWDVMRFANWMNNGQGNGDTEDGALSTAGRDAELGHAQRECDGRPRQPGRVAQGRLLRPEHGQLSRLPGGIDTSLPARRLPQPRNARTAEMSWRISHRQAAIPAPRALMERSIKAEMPEEWNEFGGVRGARSKTRPSRWPASYFEGGWALDFYNYRIGFRLAKVIPAPPASTRMAWEYLGNAGNGCDLSRRLFRRRVGWKADRNLRGDQRTVRGVPECSRRHGHQRALQREHGQRRLQGGIERAGSEGSYAYTRSPGREELPVNYVSFYDALRFANWLVHLQPSGTQGNATTEDGAYTITAQGIADNSIARKPGASFFVTSEDEWYKAAYYDAGTASYFDYPAKTDAPTACAAPNGAANQANCGNAVADLTPRRSYPGSRARIAPSIRAATWPSGTSRSSRWGSRHPRRRFRRRSPGCKQPVEPDCGRGVAQRGLPRRTRAGRTWLLATGLLSLLAWLAGADAAERCVISRRPSARPSRVADPPHRLVQALHARRVGEQQALLGGRERVGTRVARAQRELRRAPRADRGRSLRGPRKSHVCTALVPGSVTTRGSPPAATRSPRTRP
jgi:hypothetical protein